MSRLTKAAQAERTAAIDRLREWIKPGDTVYTILDHVSSSGMSRAIRVVLRDVDENGKAADRHPNWAVGKALDLRHWKRQGREQDALVVGGCGMDMGFHLVYELSYVLYGKGYACLGKGKCPSNYHTNHHDQIRCPGIFDASREVGDQYRHCYPIDSIRRRVDIGDGQTIDGGRMYGREEEINGVETSTVCMTCDGTGYIDNPEGPERFDLTHTDGYALRHRWL